MKIYFSHDADAHRDIRMLEMRAQFGWEGYGWFWAIVETMREQESFKLPWNTQLLAFKLGVSDETRFSNFLERCVSIGLFTRDDSFFWADSLLERMQQMQRLSRKRSASAKQMHSKRSASAEQVQSNCTGNIKVNIKEDPSNDLSVSMPASSDAAHTPNSKIAHGEHGLVFLTPDEVQKFKTVLGDDGFEWCVAKLDGWIHAKQPARGKLSADARKALVNGQNARHTFDSWVIRSWHEFKTSLNRSEASALYAKRANAPDIPRHIQQSINYTDALLAEARRQDAEDEKNKKLLVN